MIDFETHPIGTAKRIEELEAKLAKAVKAIEQIQTASDAMMLHIARTTLAELKGNNNDS